MVREKYAHFYSTYAQTCRCIDNYIYGTVIIIRSISITSSYF